MNRTSTKKDRCIRNSLLTGAERRKVIPHVVDYRIGVGAQPEAEYDDARFRFAWRLSRCKAVPREALAWLDELPTPAAGGH